ncbi:MAG TPA: hypothetical protein VIM33_00855 [Gaiellaceae bacterium]
MRNRLLTVVLGVSAVAAAAGLAGCGGSSPKGDVNTAFNKMLKATILVDSRGRTLYLFDADQNNTPTCYDDATYHCSKAWPPLLVHGAVRAGKGVNTSLLKTVKRTGGTVQVTYNRHPLYTFNGYQRGNAPDAPADTKPGDVHGQNYIGYWWVLSPAGKPIKTTPSGSGY